MPPVCARFDAHSSVGSYHVQVASDLGASDDAAEGTADADREQDVLVASLAVVVVDVEVDGKFLRLARTPGQLLVEPTGKLVDKRNRRVG